ncbi:MAG: aspartate kinase [Candidatus Bathyarchaeia archaeon]
MSAQTIVVKFGGSCLSTPASLVAAAQKVAVEVRKGRRVIVVVSALAGVTDSLLDAAMKSTSKKISPGDLDAILSMGERTVVPLMVSALKAQGLEAIGIDPESDIWPILTDSTFGNAKVKMEETQVVVQRMLKPLLERGCVPVVPGFVGRSPEGKVTTLGRGGSDITAVVLGSCVGADEVVFVKDVGGVLSADPKRVNGAKKIDALDVEEIFSLTLAGAKILNPKALTYKRNSLTLRVVGFSDADLSGGTVITGELESDISAELHGAQISMITLVGQGVSTSTTALKVVSEAVSSGYKVLGVTMTPSSILLYVENPHTLVEHLHGMIQDHGVAKAIHSFDSLAMVVVSGRELERIPGIVNLVVGPLARNNINIYGIMTISSSVRVFVPWESREQVLALINRSLEEFKASKGEVECPS